MNRDQVQEAALAVALDCGRCTLALSVGLGKTRVALKHYAEGYPNEKALVVIPRNPIKKSWLAEMDKIGFEYGDNFEFVTYLSLNKKDPSKYSIVYMDEVHSIKASHEDFLSRFKGSILGLTGTPPKYPNDEKAIMIAKYCPIAYSFSINDSVDSEILNDYKIVVHRLWLSDKKNLKKNRKDGGSWMTSEKADYDYLVKRVSMKNNLQNNLLLMRGLMSYRTKVDYAKKLLEAQDKKTIVFANTKKQADYICDHSVHSSNPDSDINLSWFNSGEIQKLSAVDQLSEGVTIQDLEVGIIMHSYSSDRKTVQRIGRLLRLMQDKTATCHILCYAGTRDETWVQNALEEFNKSKIIYKDVR